jgi:hypothetical protein
MAKKKRTYAQTRRIYVNKMRMSPKMFESMFGKGI